LKDIELQCGEGGTVGVDLAEAQGPGNASSATEAADGPYPHVTVGMARR
jgi:hypothetical protein